MVKTARRVADTCPVLTSHLLRSLKISTATSFILLLKCHVYLADEFPLFLYAKFHSSMSKPLPYTAAFLSK